MESGLTPPATFHKAHAQRHRQVLRSVKEDWLRNSCNPEFVAGVQAAFDASIAEVSAGTTQGPFSISEIETRYGHGRFRVIARHAIWQGSKWRAIDDARANGLNAAAACPETVSLLPPDLPAALAQEFNKRLTDRAQPYCLGGGVDDETAAYRSNPPDSPEFTVVVQIDPSSGSLVALLLEASISGCLLLSMDMPVNLLSWSLFFVVSLRARSTTLLTILHMSSRIFRVVVSVKARRTQTCLLVRLNLLFGYLRVCVAFVLLC